MSIAVIGAGVSGLTFAAVLLRRDPSADVRVYERDAAPDARSQGYSLGLKGDGAIPVLRSLDAMTALDEEAVPVTDFVFLDRRGRRLMELPDRGEPARRTVRVRRTALMAALRALVPADRISWGRTMTGFRPAGTTMDVAFEGGGTIKADQVIAADGIDSVARRQWIGDEKRYLGLTAIVGDGATVPDHELLAGGYFMTLGPAGTSVFAYREPTGVHLSYTRRSPAPGPGGATAADLHAELVAGTLGWHDPIGAIVGALQPETLGERPYFDREPLKRIRHGRLWLIGDAAHPMAPFQGQGANMAMVDARLLAELLSGGSERATGEEAVESDIVSRGRKAVLDSRRAAAQFHTTSRVKQFNRDVGFRIADRVIRWSGGRRDRRTGSVPG